MISKLFTKKDDKYIYVYIYIFRFNLNSIKIRNIKRKKEKKIVREKACVHWNCRFIMGWKVNVIFLTYRDNFF